jgi:NADPH-dependent glutamate synthase beta subunit-like oxidoreductase/ferredoxin/coenzyme F420-reducing hydrogenase delta subunit
MAEAGLTSKDLAQLSGTAELMERLWAPCRFGCPVHADVRSYLECIAQGRFVDAVDVIRRNLPFACVCGRVCHHPCEANCRRNDVDSAVAIRELKRFVAEQAGAKEPAVRKAAAQDRQTVAIIGAGPAGLSAALELAKAGYRPTVFEKFPRAGGVPATAIPVYRLPRDVLQMDVDWICAHGVKLATGVAVGKDKTLDQLLSEGFSAVLIAAGLSRSRPLPLPGDQGAGVHGALEFLTAAAMDRAPALGKDVLVIGGGNVATDAARTALRAGAGRVRMMCLEASEEMPAFPWEQAEAQEEGIEFIHRRGPTEVRRAGGRITGVATRRVTRVFDEQKRFDPRYDDGDVSIVECDTVILAIGQAAEYGFLAGSTVKLNARKQLEYNPATCQTNVPAVFAAGEIVTPPGSVVEACASGQRAARAMDLFLRGLPIVLDDVLPPHIDKIAPATADLVRKVRREPVAAQPPQVRRKNFAEVDHSYRASTALHESRRCMGCGSGAEVLTDKCAACLTCLRVCPFDIPVVTDVARIDPALCQACGICVAECPANAIVPRGHEPGWLGRLTAAALAEGSPKRIAYVCGHLASQDDWLARGEGAPGVREIYLPSMGAIATGDLLAAFEQGAEAVFLLTCQDAAERYPSATVRLRKRAAQARQMLKAAGIKSNCLAMFELTRFTRPAIRETLAEAVAKLAAAKTKAKAK